MIDIIIAVKNSPFVPFGISRDELSDAIAAGYIAKRRDSYKLTAKGRDVYSAFSTANPYRFEAA